MASVMSWSTKSRLFCRSPPVLQAALRLMSSETTAPLYAWLGSRSDAATIDTTMLLPVARPSSPNVANAEDLIDLVNARYCDHHFVGGMGESDPGVALIGYSRDALELDYWHEAWQRIQEQRHGVPLHVHTNGLVADIPPSLPVSTLRVSLWAANPPDYAKATGCSDSFGIVCGTIATAAELGYAVHVNVLPEHAATSRELALSLGAQEIHVIDKET